MDIATHLLVPYAATLAAFGFWRRGHEGDRRRASIAAVVGVSGFAPDLDGLVDPLSVHFDALYWLQHRGASHTLLFAPLSALALVGTLALLARRWPRAFGLFSWRAAFLPWLVLGSWTHLVLDAVTLSGVPLWWPFHHGRVGFMLFHWLVIWLLPVGAIALGLHAWGRLSRRGVVVAGALVVAVLLVLGGARLAMRPDVEEGERLFPRDSLDEWIVVRELQNGSWEASLLRGDESRLPVVYEHRVPPEAEAAVARALDTDAYRGFRMGSYGPLATYAERIASDGDNSGASAAGADVWRVTVTDVAQRYEATHDPRWTPTEPFEDWGYVAFEVDAAGVRVLHRGW